MRVILSSCLLTCLLSNALFAQAKINILEGTTFSIGTVARGQVVNHDLTIQNPGKDTLIISRVDVSCGCTGSMLSTDHIPPGGSGSLQITFNSKNFRGPIHKTVTVNSNAPGEQAVQISFDGTVTEEISISPEYLWFQDATVGVRSEKSVTIKNEGKTAFQLTGYSTGLAGVNINLPTGEIKSGDSVIVPIEFIPEKPVPVVADRIVIRTSHPTQTELPIGIYGNIKSGKEK
ncbi:MAG: DUF1573 domain-containing protein [Bacteroidota bacterium]